MSPIALNSTYTGTGNGNNSFGSPNLQPTVDAPPFTDVHATARRTPEGGLIKVESEGTVYDDARGEIRARFTDKGVACTKIEGGRLSVKKVAKTFQFKTDTKIPKVGLMMVGIGGNNGTTVCATVLANRHNISWSTKTGPVQPNYIGSLIRASTLRLGFDPETGKDVNIPFSDVLPMVHPNDLVLGGWDISAMPLDKAMSRAQVLDYDLQRQLFPLMKDMGKPLPSIYYPDFIAANQEDRADNLIPGDNKAEHLERIRQDIRDFKAQHGLDKVVVLWTANTERYSELIDGVNDTADNLLNAVKNSHEEVSPSTLFAIASILEGCPYINGSPSNAFVPGCVELAERHKAFIGGDDFKSGQTKFKSVVAEFLVNAGIKPLSIASYNHLGNNDGKNLSSQRQFRSKEISKSSVVDDMVAANPLLFKTAEELNAEAAAKGVDGDITKKGEHPDHLVVIKYAPAVGDDKRALDEYYSELLMGGRNTLSVFNICEDSLLATPLILDLTILAELMTRITYRQLPSADVSEEEVAGVEFQPLYSVLSLLSYMLKAPLVKPGTDVVNSLNRQRNALETFMKACLGLEHSGDLLLDTRVW
ncbi:hypothetical protein NliqN6_2870 [Naganishia liquefaciens]|uniref:Inositol-3-phosphate synthase n=1 Tax=Naganishia liquefaciens TaxID=104408 RepID=A0A8H3YEP1_9TREE|nr:hypothetical protein NliqN6_2870 [Naganishia liquefaciens]